MAIYSAQARREPTRIPEDNNGNNGRDSVAFSGWLSVNLAERDREYLLPDSRGILAIVRLMRL
jgi:hypothetical protein